MNALYERMLSTYDQSTDTGRRNAIYEVSQQLVLAGLSNGGFFDKAAFYGGTCLRIFHGLEEAFEEEALTEEASAEGTPAEEGEGETGE